jgi:5-methylcytosine-specific restriction protein A
MPKTRRRYFGWFEKTKQRHCAYCGIRLQSWGPHRITADHVRPLSKHGYDKRKNVVACCYECNQQKGTRSAEEFRRDLAQKQYANTETNS